MSKIPELLEYFLFDIMFDHPALSAKKMFGDWAVFAWWKIFIIFSAWEFFVKENNLIEKIPENRFSYKTKTKTVFMNYYRLDANEFEDRDLMEKMLEEFLENV